MKVLTAMVTAALLAAPVVTVAWTVQSGRLALGNPTISQPATTGNDPAAPAPAPPKGNNPPPPVATVPTPPTTSDVRPNPAPPALPAWSKASALQEAVNKAMADFPGRYSVVVTDLKTGRLWTVNANDRYHPASTIKMPVTLYALDRHLAGELGWQDLITYTSADFESPGGGAFETTPFGGKYPVENLVNRALMYSNNVAVNMLGRHLGWDNIRAFTRSIDGELYRLPDGTPQVTAMSETGWWLHLHKLSQENPKKAELLLGPLREVAYSGRIAAGLPEGVRYLHKFGSYDGNFHDGGIIYTENPYVLVVLTGGAKEHEADTAIAELSGAIYQVMTQP